jgi:hypothetical protein
MSHPDPEVLAEFRAGLISGRRGARISAHLATCEHCAGLCGELAEVSALLAAVSAPAMPDSVTQRIEGVLAAEAARRHDSERAAADRPAARPSGSPPRRHWDFRLVALRVLAPAAALAVLAAGAYGLSLIAGRPASSVASGTASTASAAAARPQASALPSAGPASRPEAVPAIGAGTGFQVVTSGTQYQRATFRQQLEREIALNARAAAGSREPASASLRGCVSRVTGSVSPGPPVLVENAHFGGQAAIVIVAANGHGDTAWVTASGCSASSDDVLDQTTLPGTSAP